MTYASLFAGIGGFDLALDRLGHQSVYANDSNTYCKQIYDRHFTPGLDPRPIETVPTQEIPDHDLLVGGFPCQAFSIAGKRRGFDDIRGTLFFEIARIAAGKRPPYLLLENVKGLLSHDGGRTFERILRTLVELGYDVQWQVVNSKDFGVPQNRERVIIVGHLRGQPRPHVFPLLPSDSVASQPCPQAKPAIARALRAKSGGPDLEQEYVAETVHGAAIRGRDGGVGLELRVDGVGNALRTAGGGSSTPLVAYRGHVVNEATGIARTVKAGVHGVPGGEGLVRAGLRIRRLTPVECERLQGFPDGWTAGVSNTQRYKALGNAVTVNVIYQIAKRAFSYR